MCECECECGVGVCECECDKKKSADMGVVRQRQTSFSAHWVGSLWDDGMVC